MLYVVCGEGRLYNPELVHLYSGLNVHYRTGLAARPRLVVGERETSTIYTVNGGASCVDWVCWSKHKHAPPFILC